MIATNYYERKQFLVYDITNFIADFGGYLGLLLGYPPGTKIFMFFFIIPNVDAYFMS